jgi:MarR family transcriptional regulator, organic hydroperoxide resistance regulator
LQDAEFIIKTIRSLDQYFEKSLQRKVEQSGVTIPQMRVIKEVVKQHGISIKDISLNLNMTQSTVSGIVERLINKGFLMKKTKAEDKRFAEIWYTDSVAKFLEYNSTDFVSEALNEVFTHLQPNDLKIIKQGIHLLLNAVQKAEEHK